VQVPVEYNHRLSYLARSQASRRGRFLTPQDMSPGIYLHRVYIWLRTAVAELQSSRKLNPPLAPVSASTSSYKWLSKFRCTNHAIAQTCHDFLLWLVKIFRCHGIISCDSSQGKYAISRLEMFPFLFRNLCCR
jgi:hypothetical protein